MARCGLERRVLRERWRRSSSPTPPPSCWPSSAAPASAPTAADRQSAALLRRRFGVALPPPFAAGRRSGRPAPLRSGRRHRRSGHRRGEMAERSARRYRGVLPDEFLDRPRASCPPVVLDRLGPPSHRRRRHSLIVLGRPGEVLGYCDAGPCRDDDVDPAVTGEIYELYLDPTAQRTGGGRPAARRCHRAVGRRPVATDLRLWVLRANDAGPGVLRGAWLDARRCRPRGRTSAPSPSTRCATGAQWPSGGTRRLTAMDDVDPDEFDDLYDPDTLAALDGW